MAGSAVLINEIGSVGLDHLLVEELSEEIILLESGCLCCTVRGDLSRSLRELFMRRLRREIPALDRVVIETTGLADPAPVIHTLLKDFFLAERYRLEGVVTTVDVRHVHWQLAQHPEAVKQVAMADRVILTKCDLADSVMMAEAREQVLAHNPCAFIWHADPNGAPENLLTDLGLYDPVSKTPDVLRWLNESALLEQARLANQSRVFKSSAPAALHKNSVMTHLLVFEQPIVWSEFSRTLDVLQSVLGSGILRIKGLLAVQGEAGPRVIHAVQHDRYPDQYLADWPDDDRRSRLIFIVDDLPRSVLEKAFSAFALH